MIDSVATALGCSHGLAYSIMHDLLKFQKVCAQWVSRVLKDQEKLTGWVCPCNISDGMQMKEKIRVCSIGLLLGTNHGCFTTNPNQSMLQCNRNIPVHLQSKCLKYKVMESARKVMLIMFWDSQGLLLAHFQKYGENINSSSYQVLCSSVEASGCNSQKTSRPTGKRGTASLWQCQTTPYSPSNPGENSRTTVGTSWTSALQPRLGP
jgi:hypothetical protein